MAKAIIIYSGRDKLHSLLRRLFAKCEKLFASADEGERSVSQLSSFLTSFALIIDALVASDSREVVEVCPK
jgi:hypothetical protein